MRHQTHPTPDGYLSVTEAAKVSGFDKTTLHKAIRRGVLPSYKIVTDRKLTLVCLEDVEKLRQPIRQDVPEPATASA